MATFTESLHPRDGGKFATSAGHSSGGGGATRPDGSRVRPKSGHAPAAKKDPAGTLAFNGKTGPGYGKPGGDPKVHQLQEALNRLGMTDVAGHKLAKDGKLGPRTTQAVKAAQRRLGLPADGKVTPTLLKQLTSAKSITHKGAGKAKAPVKRSAPVIDQPEDFARTYALIEDMTIERGGDGRTVTAYAAVFGVRTEIRDQHGHYHEEVSPTAFAKTLVERAGRVGVFYNHGYNLAGKPDGMLSVPLGSPLEIKPDGRGLVTVTRYNDSPLADHVLSSIRNGDIKGQSFKGRAYKSTRRREAGSALPIVTRTELGLVEYGPTPFPAYEGAGIMAVRAEQVVASIAGLNREERAELLRMLSSTPDEPLDDVTTSDVEAGTDESRPSHSARLLIARRNIARARLPRR